MKHWREWLGAFAIIGTIMFALLYRPRDVPAIELNYLKSAVYDLDHQTPANAGVLTFECDGWLDRATVWREKKLPEDLIARYMEGCRTQPAMPHRGN